MDFAKSVSFKSYGEKNYFFAALARSALRRVRVQSDLLDGTAFQASTLVACTEGPPHKEKYTYFALCFYFLGKLTRPRLVHCAHAAILRQTSPDHTHCHRVVYYHIIMCMLWLFATVYTLLLLMSLLCHTRTPRLMHFCAFILLIIAYYAGIMLDAFVFLICQILC